MSGTSDINTSDINAPSSLHSSTDDHGHSELQPLLPLEINALSYAAGNKTLLHNIEITLRDHGITVILGHNGAGKSLLLRVMHGLLPPGSGSVRWNHKDVSALEVRKCQAMVFQKPVVLRRSVAANIDYALSLRGKGNPALANKPRQVIRDELLQAANLLARAKQSATSLSGGEQQRLAIARALATSPSVMFLDEPTASMDPAATAAIEEQIQSVSQSGIKIIMVTHNIAQAKRLANDIVFLHQGTVTEHSPASSFFNQAASSAAQNYLDGQL